MASTISAGTTSTTALVYSADTSGVLQLQTNGTTAAVTIDTSQRVGIGTASPSYLLQVTKSSNGDVISWNATSGKQGYLYADTNAVSIGDTSSVNGQNILFNTTNTYVATYTNGTEKMRVDGSGNLGLGVTPSTWTGQIALQVGQGASLVGASGSPYMELNANLYFNGSNRYLTSNYATQYVQNNGQHQWYNAPSGTAGNAITFTQAMTLDNSGNLLVGTTSATYNSQVQVGNTNPAFYINNTLTSSLGSSNILRLAFSGYDINNGACNFIQAYGTTTLRFNVDSRGNVTNSNNSYGAISDVKLKENIVDATPKLADLLKVQVRNYNLKSDPTVKQLGVVAQELETVFPAMVEETPDTDEKGNSLGTFTKSVKYSVFVPMLVKAIQELSAQVTTLQSQVAALTPKA
jgi:hypothetical protein